MAWFVYIVKCADGTFYTGMTKDVTRRVAEHSAGKGAKYTRTRCPVKLVYSKRAGSISLAMKKELKIKRMNRTGKMKIILKYQAVSAG